MQIGDAPLDAVCDTAIIPAITDAGLIPRRVDRHNEGDLLKSEIVQFIERSQIIVADLTNERPNCYLEVGYAMGLGKKANLILVAREDHHWSSPGFNRNGPRVHFDLEGYDILFWNPDDLPKFRDDLSARIQRRAAIVQTRPVTPPPASADSSWVDALRTRAVAGLASVERHGYMEVVTQITPPASATQAEIPAAMRDATVSTFGWPIGLVLDAGDDRPRPTVDGVEAEVSTTPGSHMMDRASYDLWKVFGDGRFYTLLSLFEDERRENSIFWDTRTNRVTEALLLLVRLYRRLGASDNDQVDVRIRHAGLAGRELAVAGSNRMMVHHPTTSEDVIETSITSTVIELESDLSRYVREVIDPLLALFDFYSVAESILTDIVDGFVNGEVR